jgi:hypothetical protein
MNVCLNADLRPAALCIQSLLVDVSEDVPLTSESAQIPAPAHASSAAMYRRSLPLMRVATCYVVDNVATTDPQVRMGAAPR